ncbi:MAG TPA: A/G-specific adenine glycosylase [Acidimicrobiales bacterium]|nr:A/G-specific adenine glycosylase [Acidimicrobiales bacterium]
MAGPTDSVLDWGARHRRDLPWRHTRDPWAVLVSEVMLQQTQVARVVPRFHRFLGRFPTPAACAAAPVADVIAEWAGLGYNRRAVDLHRAATAVVERHDGRLPDELDALRALPGLGPYTARAVLAFAFEADVGVVEVNSARVLARAFAGRRVTPGEAQRLADDVVPVGEGWAWNQSLLDLGAVVCGKRAQACGECPLRPWCVWEGGGRTAVDPAEGSAGTGSRQSRFEGSDRQGRGRLVDALRRAPVPAADLPAVTGWPHDPDRARRVAATVVTDGLAVPFGDDDGGLSLPGWPPPP